MTRHAHHVGALQHTRHIGAQAPKAHARGHAKLLGQRLHLVHAHAATHKPQLVAIGQHGHGPDERVLVLGITETCHHGHYEVIFLSPRHGIGQWLGIVEGVHVNTVLYGQYAAIATRPPVHPLTAHILSKLVLSHLRDAYHVVVAAIHPALDGGIPLPTAFAVGSVMLCRAELDRA